MDDREFGERAEVALNHIETVLEMAGDGLDYELAAGGARSASDMQRALAQIEAEDDTWANVAAESFATHPMVVRRIEELRKFAASSEYRRMTA